MTSSLANGLLGGAYDPNKDEYLYEQMRRMENDARRMQNQNSLAAILGAQQAPAKRPEPIPQPEPNKVLLLLGDDE